MPNPTGTWSWRLPFEGQDPWYPAFDTLVSDIDATVRSVWLNAPGFATLVYSNYPTQTTTISSLTATTANFTVFSVAPFGPCVGSFTVQRSDTQMVFQLATAVRLQVPTPGSSISGDVYFRLVVNPGSISVVTDSSWWYHMDFGGILSPCQFTGIGSLGPGRYSVELQTRLANPAACSLMLVDSCSWVEMLATEYRRG